MKSLPKCEWFIATAVGLGAIGLSCGGRAVERSHSSDGDRPAAVGPSCAIPQSPMDNLEAVAVARCTSAVPATATLVLVAAQDFVDSSGRTSTWMVTFVDASNTKHTVRVSPAGATLEVRARSPTSPSCGTVSLPPLSSKAMVADATPRIKPYVNLDNLADVAVWQSLACASQFGVTSSRVVFVEGGHLNTDMHHLEKSMWDVYYDDAGKFIKLCGPCTLQGDPSCSPCYD